MPVLTLAQRIREVADEYRRRGYEVVVEPRGDQLPDFLLDYQPDLLARKAGESVVVEVKPRAMLTPGTELQGLARAVRDRPGWQLDLVVTNLPALSPQEVANSLSRAEVRQRLIDAAELRQENRGVAALLLAWSAAEAALRLLALDEGLELERRSSLHLMRQLVTLGLIAGDDYRRLLSAHDLRTYAAHGFRLSSTDQTLEATGTLLELTDRLLEPNTVS